MNPTAVDRDNLSLIFQRTLHASREQVFDAWTRPEQIAEWWDPTGARLTRCEIELRVGGAFVFENAAHSVAFSGVYRLIERPSKLVFEALGAVGTVLIETQGDRTHMHVTIRCSSAEHLDQFLKLGVKENTEKTFDNLVARFQPGAQRPPNALQESAL